MLVCICVNYGPQQLTYLPLALKVLVVVRWRVQHAMWWLILLTSQSFLNLKKRSWTCSIWLQALQTRAFFSFSLSVTYSVCSRSVQVLLVYPVIFVLFCFVLFIARSSNFFARSLLVVLLSLAEFCVSISHSYHTQIYTHSYRHRHTHTDSLTHTHSHTHRLTYTYSHTHTTRSRLGCQIKVTKELHKMSVTIPSETADARGAA